MDYSKPTLLVVSGPNGAGKSTHIQSMLPDQFQHIWSFDRDKTRSEFETLLSSQGVEPAEILAKATRMMEERLVEEMDKAINLNLHFVLETPLSHPDYWKYIDRFEKKGYQIQLNYLCLNKVKDCIARVGQRVLEGGHYVDPRTIKGVYEMNLKFIDDFHSTFKVIELYDGTMRPELLLRLEDDHVSKIDNGVLKKKWIKTGLPQISRKVTHYIELNKINSPKKIRIRKSI